MRQLVAGCGFVVLAIPVESVAVCFLALSAEAEACDASEELAVKVFPVAVQALVVDSVSLTLVVEGYDADHSLAQVERSSNLSQALQCFEDSSYFHPTALTLVDSNLLRHRESKFCYIPVAHRPVRVQRRVYIL